MRKNRGLKDSQIQSPTSRKAGKGKPGMQENRKGPDPEIQARRAKGEQDGFLSAPPAKEMTPGYQRWRRVKEL